MRRIFITALALTMTLFAFGQQVSVESALAKAMEFKKELNENADFQSFNSIRKKLKGASQMTLAYTAAQNDEVHFYVFNNPGGGWVMVSGDEAVDTEILAYNYEGSFVYENAPENLKYWLNKYEREISSAIKEKGVKGHRAIRKGLAKSAIAKTGLGSDVSPLIETQWNQDAPFNNMCPELGGVHCLTGCVATAMSQIMKYYEWPEKGYGGHSYHDTYNADANSGSDLDLSSDFSAHTYDYANMQNTASSFTTDVQKQAVSQLMYDCGVSIDMMYGTLGSGAVTEYIPDVMARYFGYSKDAKFWHFTDFPNMTTWKSYIYADLKNGNPVLYSGGSVLSGGHQFICDGYQNSTDKFHFNWGWGGKSDGYFELGVLNPDGDNFSEYEDCVLGLVPDKTSAECTIKWYSQGAEYKSTISLEYHTLAYPISPKVEGYEFMGWTAQTSVNSDGTSITYVNDATPASGDATYYAVFARKTVDDVRPFELDICVNPYIATDYDENDLYYFSSQACSTDGLFKSMWVDWKPMRIRANGDNLQWEKGNGILYNLTDLGTVKEVNVTKSAGDFTVYKGSTLQPITSGAGGYFAIYNDDSTDGIVSNINIKFECAQEIYSDYTLTPVGNSTSVITTKLSDYAYATFYSDKKKAIPSGVEAYIVKDKSGDVVAATKLTQGIIPANCGVIVRSSAAGTFLFTDTGGTTTEDVSGNLLTGWTECKSITGNASVSYYALNYKNVGSDKVVGFFAPLHSGSPTGTFTAQAGKAYLKLTGGMAKDIMIDFDDATSIAELPTVKGQQSADIIYNLAGQKVGADYKGIIIVNGKKMLNK